MYMPLCHRLFAGFLVLSLLLCALVPAGYMPDMAALAKGVVRITICTAMGRQDILVDKNLKQVDPGSKHHQKQANDFCAFGTVPHPFTPPPALLQLLIALLLVAAVWQFIPQQFIFSILNRAARSRAPPVMTA